VTASRESYAAAAERLEALATGERPVPLAGVADEILGVAGLLERQPRLRRALADPARTGAERAELLGSLLEGKVSADADVLVRTLVAGRWSSSGELLDATERLGVEALLASLNAIPVAPGDAVLVPAGVPHAIGEGVLLVDLAREIDGRPDRRRLFLDTMHPNQRGRELVADILARRLRESGLLGAEQAKGS